MEILSPAGNFEKLQLAVNYGADAVYLSGHSYGLRHAADNFNLIELENAVTYAHGRNVRVYVTCNAFFHDQDFENFTDFLHELQRFKVDAIIASDLGVIEEIKRTISTPIHLSTQASCLNSYSAQFWKERGVRRIILGREASLAEASLIKRTINIEVEVFIHGALCMAHSGHCVISNYTEGRDSNRGGCAHSCRFEYTLSSEHSKVKKTFMSSQDLMGVELLKTCLDLGIDSLKIEGRMKGTYYLSAVTKAYVEARRDPTRKMLEEQRQELEKIDHRQYTSGYLEGKPTKMNTFEEGRERAPFTVVGIVRDIFIDQFILMEVKTIFTVPVTLEVLTFRGGNIFISLKVLEDIDGDIAGKMLIGRLIKVPYRGHVEKLNLVRMSL